MISETGIKGDRRILTKGKTRIGGRDNAASVKYRRTCGRLLTTGCGRLKHKTTLCASRTV